GAGRPVQTLKARHRRVQRDAATLRESHHRDPRRIDPRMRDQQSQSPVGIAEHREAAELRLIISGERDAPAREAIEEERRGAGLLEILGPSILAWAYSAGAVNEHDGRAAFNPARRKVKVAPYQVRGRGPDALEELGCRRRGRLEA